jgi:hypothetical protein
VWYTTCAGGAHIHTCVCAARAWGGAGPRLTTSAQACMHVVLCMCPYRRRGPDQAS